MKVMHIMYLAKWHTGGAQQKLKNKDYLILEPTAVINVCLGSQQEAWIIKGGSRSKHPEGWGGTEGIEVGLGMSGRLFRKERPAARQVTPGAAVKGFYRNWEHSKKSGMKSSWNALRL